MPLSVAWIALYSGCLQAGTTSSFTVVPPGPTASTYTRRAHTDCDAGGCRTFRRVGECGSPPAYPTMTPCNVSVLEALCDAAAGCAGFNTNGWLQAHIDPASLKNTSSCDLYVRDAGPASAYVFPAAPPGPPVPVREDYHYPAEAPDEAERHPAPAVLRVNYTPRGPCTVELGAVDNASKQVVPSRFNGWELLSCVLADDHDEPQLVMQRTFRRWSVLVFAGTRRPAVSFRSSVGAAAEVHMPRYNFTAIEPDYFVRAVHERGDYIGRRTLEISGGEPTIVDAMRFESPGQEYALFGVNAAPVKWVACPDGVIKRSDAALLELGNNDTSAGCHFSNPTPGLYLAGYLNATQFRFASLAAAMQACCASVAPNICGGVTKEMNESGEVLYSLRAGTKLETGKPADESWLCLSCASARSVVFDPWAVVGFLPDSSLSEYKSGLLSGFLRVVSVSVWDRSVNRGIELLTFGSFMNTSHQVFVRLRSVNGSTVGGGGDGDVDVSSAFRYFFASTTGWGEMSQEEGDQLFYSELLRYADDVHTGLFGNATQLLLPAADQRQHDMAFGAILLSYTDWVGNAQNYGAGAVYWGPNGSLSLTTFALINPMLWFGMTTVALEHFGYYLSHFIADDGRLPGKCRGLPANMTEGNFNDGLSDYGRLLDMYTRAVLYSRNVSWAQEHAPAVERIADYLLGLRANAKQGPSPSPWGFIWGPAEHDRCHDPDYYFDINVWSWRGLLQLGRLHTAGFSGTAPLAGLRRNETYGGQLLEVAADWSNDINRAAAQMAVLDDSGKPIFLPSVARAGPRLASEQPYTAMWQGVNSSYANFRYWSETILATALPSQYERAMLSFRAERGGTLGGMSTYEDHLDDMPIEGYAYGQLRQDNISQFLLQLSGHAANYAARGTFGTTEQFSLYSTLDSRWRDYLPAKGQLATPRNPAELSLDFCEPSQMQMAIMSRWQLVMEEPDEATLWIARCADSLHHLLLLLPAKFGRTKCQVLVTARGAPRRWYVLENSAATTDLLFGIRQSVTRFGVVSAEVHSASCPTLLHTEANCAEAMEVWLSLEVIDPPDQPVNVYARVRSPYANTTIVRAELRGQHAGVEAVTFRPARELIEITVTPPVVGAKVLVVLGANTM